MPNLVTVKTSEEARRMLKIIAGHTDEKQYEIMERLLKEEMKRKKYRLDSKGRRNGRSEEFK